MPYLLPAEKGNAGPLQLSLSKTSLTKRKDPGETVSGVFISLISRMATQSFRFGHL